MRLSHIALSLLGATMLTGPALAQTLPTGHTVVNGQVTVGTPVPGSMQINQTSGAAIINWDTFSIGTNGIVNVTQPSAAAALLNRVTGTTPSTIAGQLTSNGQVFLVNPNGIAITPTGVVNTGAFTASTLGIKNYEFMAGNYRFKGDGSSEEVSNAGQINIAPGGYAALIGGQVDNSGSIIAPFGRIGLGSAEMVTMSITGDDFLTVAIPSQGHGNEPLVSNSGLLSADGGYIQMTVAAAQNLQRNVINLSGTAEARSVSGVSGNIILSGDGGAVKVTGTVNTSSAAPRPKPQPQTIIVPIPAARPSYRGGDITITGGAIKLADATIDASGYQGGGDIKIGGDWHGNGLIPTATKLNVDYLTRITSNALINGNGGDIVLWSDHTTTFAGKISSRGAGVVGSGGDVEVSGKIFLNNTGLADLRAPSGKWGTLLLDPANIQITASAPFATYSAYDPVVLGNQLALADVVINTSTTFPDDGDVGNILVTDTVAWGTGSTLTLIADANLGITGGLGLLGADGNIVLRANGDFINGTTGQLLQAVNVTIAGRNIELGELEASGTTRITATGFVDLNTPITTGDLIITAAGNITPIYDQATITATGNITMTSGNDLFLGADTTTAGGNVTLTAARDAHIAGDWLISGQLRVVAGRNIAIETPFPDPSPPVLTGPGQLAAVSAFLQAGGTLVIRAGAFVRSTNGDVIINTGVFTNNAGATAINADGGRVLIYSTNWANDTRGGLTGANLYGRTYAANPPSSIPGGDAFIYSARPTLTITVADLIRMYFERNLNPSAIAIAGLVNGDTFDYATDGTPTATDTTPIFANPGTYAGAMQLLGLTGSTVGYDLVVVPGTVTVTPSPTTAPPPGFNVNALPPQPPELFGNNPDLVANIEETDDIDAVIAIEVTPGAAEISLQAVERASQQFGADIAECERRLASDGDDQAYLSCAGDALDKYADALENPLIKLPPELKATVQVIRQTAQRVRTAAASPNRAQAVREARAAVGELVDFVKTQTALVRAVDPETQNLLQQTGEVMTQALQELDLQLVSAVEI